MSYERQIDRTDDREYFECRAAEEALRAEQAASPEAKRVHSDLSALFARKAAQIQPIFVIQE
jgi:hypothetical protein